MGLELNPKAKMVLEVVLLWLLPLKQNYSNIENAATNVDTKTWYFSSPSKANWVKVEGK